MGLETEEAKNSEIKKSAYGGLFVYGQRP